MSLIIETNSFNINAIPCDKIVLTVNKGAMLRDVRAKSCNNVAKSDDKGAKSSNKGTMLSDKGVMSSDKGALSSDKGAMSVDKGAMSVRKAQKLIDFEVFEIQGFL